MCRITGYRDLRASVAYDHTAVITAMRDTLTHGGPDDAGLYVSAPADVALGHRRLSILDLSPLGHQPMAFEELVIVYNGEAYNFADVRQELQNEGYDFASTSDTEVVLKAWHRWGQDALPRFRGMWAFAIWDRSTRTLTLCRDRIGVKPLYWHYHDGLFLFASELKALHRHPRFRPEVDPASLALFFENGYIAAPHSIYRHTYKLEPGCTLTLDAAGEVTVSRYWSIAEHYEHGLQVRQSLLDRPEQELTDELEGVLTEAFNLRMVSDVPVGMFLSGGIDSSLVTALIQKSSPRPVRTYTIGFHEQQYNEAIWAKKVAQHLGTEHTELYCTQREAFDVIPQLPHIYDEPFGDSSGVPTTLVAQLARRDVKVSLSADGGDEQFCGYTRYWMIRDRVGKLASMPGRQLLSAGLRMLSPDAAQSLYRTFSFALPKWTNFRDKYMKFRNALNEDDLVQQYLMTNRYFLTEQVQEMGLHERHEYLSLIERGTLQRLDPLSKLMYIDHLTYLPDDIMVKVDRATMHVALEGREPFLDPRVLAFSAALPHEWKYRQGRSKYLLRKVLERYLPSELIERPKQGFGVPVFEWFHDELSDLVRQYLTPERIRARGLLDERVVSEMVRDFFEGRGVNVHRLWFLLMFEMWADTYM